MLSRKTKYGLQSVIYLAKRHGKGPVLITELAKSEGIPQKFLEAILLDLRNKGILQSKKGKGGGYFLARAPQDITMGEIIRVLEGPLAPVPCVSQMAYRKCEECKSEADCEIRRVMKEVRDAMAKILDNTTLSDVITTGNSGLSYVI
jgi:Rrf2 family protein